MQGRGRQVGMEWKFCSNGGMKEKLDGKGGDGSEICGERWRWV